MATIRKRGSKWQAQIRRKHAPALSRSFARKTDAEAWNREMEVEADRRLLRHDPRILDQMSVADLVLRYRDTISVRKRDAKIEMDRLSRFSELPVAKLCLSAIEARDFAEYRDLRLQSVSGSTVNRELAPLQHMFQVAVEEWGLPITGNPLKSVRRPRNNPGRERRLLAGEEQRLLSAAEDAVSGYMFPAIIIALETAMRRSEILRIEHSHLSEAHRTLRIPQTKTHRPRTVPLSDRAIFAIRDLMIAFSKNRPSRNAFKQCWARTRVRSELPGFRFHDLRHEAISRFFERGMTLPQIASISGHADYRMLARYAHWQSPGEKLCKNI